MEIKRRRPMLCCDADLSKIIYPIMGFPKIDGVRLTHLIGSATARSLNPHANIYTTTRFSDPVYTGIDSEATIGDITSRSACRDTTSALNTITGEPEIVLNAFDFLRFDVIDLVYLDRYKALEQYIKQYKPKDVNLIKFKWLKNESQVLSFYKECLDAGYEGIVLRDPHGLHKDGRGTANEASYLRLKPSSDKEALVISLVEAQANLNEKKTNALGHSERSTHKENKVGKGMVGMLQCRDVLTGNMIDVGPGKMTHKERIHFWNNPNEMVNQYVKYRSMDTGVKVMPRFARYICIRGIADIIID